MRVSMPCAGLERSGKSVGSLYGWRRGVCVSTLVLAGFSCGLPAPVHGTQPPASPTPAPAQAKPVPKRPAGTNVAGGAASGASKPEMAVVFDDIYHPPSKDLLLTLESERKAEANARFIHGLLLEETSDEDKAVAEYLKALALDPANVELSIKIAWEYLRRGDTPGAINLLKDTIKAAPKQARPCLALANIYYNNLNKVDLAQKYSLQALDLDPANITSYEYLRDIYKATGQSQKIGALLERGLKVESKDAMFWLRLGALYAEVFLADDPNKNADDLKKTTAVFQKAFTYGNNDVEVIAKIADFFVATSQLGEAVPLYKRIIDVDPALNAPRESLARCYIALNQPEKAAAALEELIKINPVQPHAYEMLAKIYEDAGQMEKAAADYEQSLLISPNDASAYESLAIRLLNLKKPERAVTILTEARKRFPEEPGFTYLLAASLAESKQFPQALTLFDQTEIEARNTNKASVLDSRFYFSYGAAAEQSAQYDKAAIFLKKSLELEDNPQRIANTSNYLGYMWVDHDKDIEGGGDLIKRALELDPDNGAYLDSLGWYYYKTNHFDQAIAQLTQAAEKLKPEDPVIYEHLGDTYLKLNDSAKAITSWQKAVELDPAGPNISALNKKITDAKAAGAAASAAPSPPSAPKG